MKHITKLFIAIVLVLNVSIVFGGEYGQWCYQTENQFNGFKASGCVDITYCEYTFGQFAKWNFKTEKCECASYQLMTNVAGEQKCVNGREYCFSLYGERWGFNNDTKKCYSKDKVKGEEICQLKYGINSIYNNYENDKGQYVCSCKTGYIWNSGKTSCIKDLSKQNNSCSYKYPGTIYREYDDKCICPNNSNEWNPLTKSCQDSNQIKIENEKLKLIEINKVCQKKFPGTIYNESIKHCECKDSSLFWDKTSNSCISKTKISNDSCQEKYPGTVYNESTKICECENSNTLWNRGSDSCLNNLIINEEEKESKEKNNKNCNIIYPGTIYNIYSNQCICPDSNYEIWNEFTKSCENKVINSFEYIPTIKDKKLLSKLEKSISDLYDKYPDRIVIVKEKISDLLLKSEMSIRNTYLLNKIQIIINYIDNSLINLLTYDGNLCNDGYYINNKFGTCEKKLELESCNILNGEGISLEDGTCKIISCDRGYDYFNNKCTDGLSLIMGLKVEYCNIKNGIGTISNFGVLACEIDKCNIGYKNKNGICEEVLCEEGYILNLDSLRCDGK